MLRDTRKDRSHFEERKELYFDIINNFFEIEDQVKPERKYSLYGRIGLYYEFLFPTCYSLGESIDQLYEYYKKNLKYSKYRIYQGMGLYSLVNYFAIGVLYSERKEEFLDDLKEIYRKSRPDKDIIEYFAAYLFEDKIIPYHSDFEYLNFITDTLDSVKYAQSFWYYDHADAPWYDSHLRDSYEGYWSWDTAAVCKIKGLIDPSLKELDYFPYDLLVQE